jgi:hypothetical protein
MDFFLRCRCLFIVDIVFVLILKLAYKSHYRNRCLVYILCLRLIFIVVGHVLPIPSATDKDGEDDELVYWLEKTTKIPFELVSFGSNQIGINRLFAIDNEQVYSSRFQLSMSRNRWIVNCVISTN